MSQAKRAAKGGEIGVNGEYYEGGQFLPSNEDRPKGTPKKKAGKPGKRQIGFYEWEVPPYEGAKPIFESAIGGAFRDRDGGDSVNDTALDYLGMTREELNSRIQRWLAGERWM